MIIRIFLTALVFLFHPELYAVETGTIKVVMTGMKNDKGVVRVALVRDKESFLKDDAVPFMGAAVKVMDGTAEAVFKDVPMDFYAIKAFHDENGSGRLETSFLDMPKEEYAFSNNVRMKNFEEAVFRLDSKEMLIELFLKK